MFWFRSPEVTPGQRRLKLSTHGQTEAPEKISEPLAGTEAADTDLLFFSVGLDSPWMFRTVLVLVPPQLKSTPR